MNSACGRARRGSSAVAAVTVSLAVVTWLTGCADKSASGCRFRSVDKAQYVAENEALLRGVPVYPGSKLIDTSSAGQPAPNSCLPRENSPPYDHFVTERRYWSPSGTPRGTIILFYRKALVPKWQLRAWSATEPPWDSTFRRGPAMLYVAEEGETVWSIGVDHDVYQSPR
jgi:hypothetical protein